METLGMEQLVSNFFLLFNLVGRHKNGKNIIIFPRVDERTTVICFFKEFRLQELSIPL